MYCCNQPHKPSSFYYKIICSLKDKWIIIKKKFKIIHQRTTTYKIKQKICKTYKKVSSDKWKGMHLDRSNQLHRCSLERNHLRCFSTLLALWDFFFFPFFKSLKHCSICYRFLLPYFILAIGKFSIHSIVIKILGGNEKEDSNFH